MVMSIQHNIITILLEIRQYLQRVEDLALEMRLVRLEQEQWLDTLGAQLEFNVTDRTLRRWRQANLIYCRVIGKKVFYSRLSLLDITKMKNM